MLSHSGPMREERQRIYGCNSNLSNLFSDAIAHEPGTSWDGTPSDRTSRRSRTRYFTDCCPKRHANIYDILQSRTMNHYHEFGPVHRSFNDRETAHGDAFNGLAHSSLRLRTITTIWSCPPIFDDRETAHGDAFNALPYSSLGLRTITTSLVLSTDHLMIARLSIPMRFWRISVSDYELLPRVWSCPPIF
ncbi:hypothetical protein DMN91_000335 [Ooceraea biroi]|uniref:Uncharacterized protein n=1 Tax=Ooceraea biroi TaxID=2015173 RepID=A0A3L8E2W6_OOCBI|nr:hypothetical protein DMN91_000335 [Ooceraea biroi]